MTNSKGMLYAYKIVQAFAAEIWWK